MNVSHLNDDMQYKTLVYSLPPRLHGEAPEKKAAHFDRWLNGLGCDIVAIAWQDGQHRAIVTLRILA